MPAPLAAQATSAVAALTSAANLSLEVDGTSIPTSAFAFWTIVAAVAGTTIAAVVRQRRHFVTITLGATAVSLVPAMFAPDDASTSVVLVTTHLLAAAILVPVLGRYLRSSASV